MVEMENKPILGLEKPKEEDQLVEDQQVEVDQMVVKAQAISLEKWEEVLVEAQVEMVILLWITLEEQQFLTKNGNNGKNPLISKILKNSQDNLVKIMHRLITKRNF